MSSHELLLNNNTEFDIIQTAKTFQPVMATKTRSWLIVIYFCKDRNVSKNKNKPSKSGTFPADCGYSTLSQCQRVTYERARLRAANTMVRTAKKKKNNKQTQKNESPNDFRPNSE